MVASIAKVGKLHTGGSSGVGLDYYLDYVERGGERGRWLGGAAGELGLGGEVARADLLAVGQGRAPGQEGAALVLRRDGRVPAWDVTFSAPKSVSVLHGLAGGEARDLLRAAHDRSVEAAVDWLETTAGRARRGPGGADGHVAVRLVVAAFVHGTSRALDPDLHTHCLVANLGLDQTGRWSSIDSRVIYRRRMAAGAVYRAELRRQTAALGLRWCPADRRDLAELAGLPKGLLRQFSKRRIDIEAALAERGARGSRAAQMATLATRATKVGVEFAECRREWRRQAAGHGWTAERAEELVVGAGPESRRRELGALALSDGDRERIVQAMLGPDGLTCQQAAFRADEVLRAWAAALPQGASPAELEALVTYTLARPEVVALVVGDEAGTALRRQHRARAGVLRLMVGAAPEDALCEPRYTTTEMLDVEVRLLSWALAGQGQGTAQLPADQIEAAIAGAQLGEEQAAMVRSLCASGDGLSVVVGVPGSGKTHALGVARQVWEAAGYRVMGVALAGRAADELARGAGLAEAQTIDSFLAGSAERIDSHSVVICDEAGMVDTRRLTALADVARRAGAKLVVVGDDRQLGPIEAGGALLALAARLGAVRLSDNRRQVEAWQRDALAAIRDGRGDEAARAYLSHGRVKVADTPAELLGLMAADWWAARVAGEDASMWAYSREAVSELNARARAHLGTAGQLGEAELAVAASLAGRLGERRFAAGDEVVCLHNRRRLAGDRSGQGVRNGTLATVIDAEGSALVVRTADGRQLSLPGRYVADWVDHSYAMTIHKAQGRTLGQVDRDQTGRQRGHAFVYGAAGLGAEAALVAASRATDVTELYVCAIPAPEPTGHGTEEPLDVGAELERAWSTSQAKSTATDLAGELERIRRLATRPRDELRQGLDDLDLLDPAAARRLDRALAEARDLLDAAKRLLADPTTGSAREQAQRDARSARAEVRYATERLARRQQLLEHWRGDLRAAGAERDAVIRALRTQRRWRQTALAADPPRWLTDLIGPAPQGSRGRAQLWWEALSVVLDTRQHRGVDDHHRAGRAESTSIWEQAVGLDPDSPDAASARSAIATIRRAREILSTPEPVPERQAAAYSERFSHSERRSRAEGSLGRSHGRELI